MPLLTDLECHRGAAAPAASSSGRTGSSIGVRGGTPQQQETGPTGGAGGGWRAVALDLMSTPPVRFLLVFIDFHWFFIGFHWFFIDFPLKHEKL